MGKPFVSFPVATALKLRPSDMTDPDPEPSVHETDDGPTRKTVMINFAGQKFRKYLIRINLVDLDGMHYMGVLRG
jgi:hypothetical protein